MSVRQYVKQGCLVFSTPTSAASRTPAQLLPRGGIPPRRRRPGRRTLPPDDKHHADPGDADHRPPPRSAGCRRGVPDRSWLRHGKDGTATTDVLSGGWRRWSPKCWRVPISSATWPPHHLTSPRPSPTLDQRGVTPRSYARAFYSALCTSVCPQQLVTGSHMAASGRLVSSVSSAACPVLDCVHAVTQVRERSTVHDDRAQSPCIRSTNAPVPSTYLYTIRFCC